MGMFAMAAAIRWLAPGASAHTGESAKVSFTWPCWTAVLAPTDDTNDVVVSMAPAFKWAVLPLRGSSAVRNQTRARREVVSRQTCMTPALYRELLQRRLGIGSQSLGAWAHREPAQQHVCKS